MSLEIALSLVLVVSSGLLAKSLIRLQHVDVGFSPDRVITLRASPSSLGYSEDQTRIQYYREALQELAIVPSVESVGAIQILPMTSAFMGVGYSPTGTTPVPDGTTPPTASYRVVTPGYRETLAIPLLRGRDLSESDSESTLAVGLVNQTLARELYPHGDPIGRSVHYEDGSPWFTIVGVIGDVHQHLDRKPMPEVYLPYTQDGWPSSMLIVARVEGDAAAIAPSLRAAVRSVDDDVPIAETRTMEDVIGSSLAGHRLRTALFVLFSLFAFALSAVGVYGVISFAVGQRTREIGLRMAFGASQARVLLETLLGSMRPVSLGDGCRRGLGAGRDPRPCDFSVRCRPSRPGGVWIGRACPDRGRTRRERTSRPTGVSRRSHGVAERGRLTSLTEGPLREISRRRAASNKGSSRG